MKVVIVGSGLIGVTTAYFLQRRGHQVTVIDRKSGPGQDASFANGGLLTPSMADPWNAPGCWRALLGSIGRSDAALKLHLGQLFALAGWGVTFLRNSRPRVFERNVRSNLSLARYSLQVLRSLREETGIDYGGAARGTLRIFRDSSALDHAAQTAEQLLFGQVPLRRLSQHETVELEPALLPIAPQLAGALYFVDDECGDAHRFCLALAELARQEGVQFRFNTEVSSLAVHARRMTAIVSERETFVADRYVVAAGSYSAALLRTAGVSLPVRPAKGYSVTFDHGRAATCLSIPVVDDHLHAAVVPLGDALRIAGTAEFAGYNLKLVPARVRNVLALLHEVLPQAALDPASAKPWTGLRPMSADGVPIISSTSVTDLMVNTGHGHLGWTMAAGSAQLLTSMLCRDVSPIDPALFALARFDY